MTDSPGKEAVLHLIRRKTWASSRNLYRILIDGHDRGAIRSGQTIDLSIPLGEHELRLAIAESPDPFTANQLGHLFASRPVQIRAQEGQVIEFVCGPGRPAFFPFARVRGEEQPDIMLKPKPPHITRRTWHTYD